MKLVIQRVASASVSVDGKIIGSIQKGLLVFLGVSNEDTIQTVKKYADKLLKLRIFSDSDGKTNLSLKDVGGSLLIISQFTLYANCQKGNRPSFIEAGDPKLANSLYEEFIQYCNREIELVESGKFGADMAVSLINDGPFTVVLENLT